MICTFGMRKVVWSNEDVSYTIFIDSSLCYERQQEVFKHEVRHILRDDFEKFDVDKIEFDAHSA